MSFVKLLGTVVLLFVASINFAAARQATAEEIDLLNVAAKAYETATEKGDAQQLAESIAPEIVKLLAQAGKTDPAQIVQGLRDQISTMTATVKFIDCSLHLDQKVAGELDDGSPYFIIPLTSIMEMGGKKKQIDSKMAAVLDDGKWYFITGNAEHKIIIGKAFPGLEKADFGTPVVKDID